MTIFPAPQECEDPNTRGTTFLKSHGMCVHVPTSLCLFEMLMPKTSQQYFNTKQMQTEETGKTATTPKTMLTAPVSRKPQYTTTRASITACEPMINVESTCMIIKEILSKDRLILIK